MDDIRRPQSPERRDYAIPVRRVEPRHSPTQAPHPHPQPPHHQAVHHTSQPHQPIQHQPHPGYSRPASAQPIQHPVRPPVKKRGLKPVIIIALPLIAGALFAAGYSFKSSASPDTIPASVTQQAKFSVYFPSPMPAGYGYMKNTATFQIGQVFYKFSDGNKRVTVKEEPLPDPKPNLSLLVGYTQFASAIGQVAMGTTFGQPTAVIVTATTVITINTSGGVSQNELKTAIVNFKNIGQNPNQKTSNG